MRVSDAAGYFGCAIQDSPVPFRCGCIPVNDAPDMKVLCWVLIQVVAIGLKQGGREADRVAGSALAILPPLLGIVAVPAQAQQIKIKRSCKSICLQKIVDTATAMFHEKVTAVEQLTYHLPCYSK